MKTCWLIGWICTGVVAVALLLPDAAAAQRERRQEGGNQADVDYSKAIKQFQGDKTEVSLKQRDSANRIPRESQGATGALAAKAEARAIGVANSNRAKKFPLPRAPSKAEVLVDEAAKALAVAVEVEIQPKCSRGWIAMGTAGWFQKKSPIKAAA